jgi:hypothetical protein
MERGRDLLEVAIWLFVFCYMSVLVSSWHSTAIIWSLLIRHKIKCLLIVTRNEIYESIDNYFEQLRRSTAGFFLRLLVVLSFLQSIVSQIQRSSNAAYILVAFSSFSSCHSLFMMMISLFVCSWKSSSWGSKRPTSSRSGTKFSGDLETHHWSRSSRCYGRRRWISLKANSRFSY